MGQYVWTTTVPGLDAIPKEYALYQNYPNPFNPSTTIQYVLSQGSHVVLTISNTLGQRVATLVDTEQRVGIYRVHLDGTDIASGTYYC